MELGLIGDPVTPRCPDCGGECAYNGNYFCTYLNCGWALPDLHDMSPGPIREGFQAWFDEALASLMKYRTELELRRLI